MNPNNTEHNSHCKIMMDEFILSEWRNCFTSIDLRYLAARNVHINYENIFLVWSAKGL